ncbi:MAG: DUF4266 domain-containing protein [Gammaproteobacteria bacterium]|nr:DUF4266 domain-containing protein [Gammaproteobacteria bacterium]
MNILFRHFIFLILIYGLNACSLEPVEPWDRDILAQKKMQLISDELENYADEHIYFSKEASTGGQGVGGGGCGCN